MAAVTVPGFVNPASYEGQTLHTDSPFKDLAEPMNSQLYTEVSRGPIQKRQVA